MVLAVALGNQYAGCTVFCCQIPVLTVCRSLTYTFTGLRRSEGAGLFALCQLPLKQLIVDLDVGDPSAPFFNALCVAFLGRPVLLRTSFSRHVC
jgi:hypothetical protein